MFECIVVVPCYNEADRLDLEAFKAFAERASEVSFLFVNDGSADHTRDVLGLLVESNPAQFSLLDLARNVGKAEAVRRGVLAALRNAPTLVGYWDADLATPLEAINEFRDILRLRPEIELTMGARLQLLGRQVERSPLRHYLGRCFGTAVSWTLGIRVYDTQCGAKLFRVTKETANMFASPFCSRWIFDVELLARMLALKGRNCAAVEPTFVYEYPLRQWRDVAGSKLRIRDYVRAMVELLTIAWRFRLGGLKAQMDDDSDAGRVTRTPYSGGTSDESHCSQTTSQKS